MKMLIIFLGFISLFAFGGCSHLFYHPTKEEYTTPDKFLVSYENVYFETSDGHQLHAWKMLADFSEHKNKMVKGTILFFHGNAENLSSHFLHLAWLTKFGYQVLIFDYRGFGRSPGKPDQVGLYQDALAAFDYSFKWHQKTAPTAFYIVYAQSLGGIVAARAMVDFPHKDKIDLLVLDSTFSSYQNIAFHKLSRSWIFTLLSPLAYIVVSDKMESKSHLPKLAPTPLLVIHGDQDMAVPYQFGEEIFSLYPGKNKWFWSIPGGQHTDIFFRPDYLETPIKLETKNPATDDSAPKIQKYRQQFIEFLDQLKKNLM